VFSRILKDLGRFREKMKARLKRKFQEKIVESRFIAKQGKKYVVVRLPEIVIPRIRFGKPEERVGVGKGEIGQPVLDESDGEGVPQAGSEPGRHFIEVEFDLEEIADMLGEELELPKIKQGGKKEMVSRIERYHGARTTGPKSLWLKNHMIRKAILRTIMLNAGEEDEEEIIIVPLNKFFINPATDKVVRSWSVKEDKTSMAVLIYLMDVSGSMGERQKDLARKTSFFIEAWLERNYKNVLRRYVIHETEAREVDKKTFFTISVSGGTKISSGYELVAKIMNDSINNGYINFYVIQFSDGDNWDNDNDRALKILKDRILKKEPNSQEPYCNIFAYVQTVSRYGSGEFMGLIFDTLNGKDENVVLEELESEEDILTVIKSIFGEGR